MEELSAVNRAATGGAAATRQTRFAVGPVTIDRVVESEYARLARTGVKAWVAGP